MDRLSLHFGDKLPVLLQTEATECGLASLAMVANFHGYRIDLASLRRRFPVSLKGATLASLIDVASHLELSTRAVKLELQDVQRLRLPCVLHWGFSHFVVLKSVGPRGVTIIDPARGLRKLSMSELSNGFTGVALELWPNQGFKPQEKAPKIKLRELMGRVTGMYRSLGQVLLLAVALEVFAIVSPFFMQWVIDDVVISEDRNLLTTLALGFGLLMVVQQVITACRSWIILYFGTTLNVQWRNNVFTHLLRLPNQYFEKRHLGDVLSRFSSVDVIQRTLTTSFVEGILDGLMTLATLVMIFIYSVTLAWVSVGAMTLYAAGRWLWYRPLRAATAEQIVYAARQQSHFLETVRGIRSIKLFCRQDERRATWLTVLVDQVNADLRTQKLLIFYKTLNGLLFGLEGVIVVWLGAKLILDGNFSVGMLTAFMSYKGQFATRVSSLIDKFVEVKMLQLQGERLADIVFTETETSRSATRLVASDAASITPSIEIRGVRYRYAAHEPLVLDGVDLMIGAGESVAISGPSGCGKTTLMHIILGILEPTEGQVLIGGTDVRHMGIDAVRSMVGTVTQDDMLFEGSISENVCFFDSHADQQWIEDCARAASIHSDIAAMPMGYNTFIGYMGSALSGGQKQRVLLARALYKRPKILLLDEATSHLDIERELTVSTAIRGMSITRVIVAHRPHTLETADVIVRMANGKVVDSRPSGASVAALNRLERFSAPEPIVLEGPYEEGVI